MKKGIIIGILVLLLAGLGLAIVKGVENDRADQPYDKTFQVKATPMKDIYISGVEQPIEVLVTETDAEDTRVTVSGKLAKNNIKALEEQFGLQKDDLVIGFTNEGFSMVVMGDKPKVKVTIALGRDATFEDFYLYGTNGSAEITLPTSFDGHYHLKPTGDGKVQSAPKDGTNTSRQAKVEVAGDINITLAD